MPDIVAAITASVPSIPAMPSTSYTIEVPNGIPVTVELTGIEDQLALWEDMQAMVEAHTQACLEEAVTIGFEIMDGMTPVDTGYLRSQGFKSVGGTSATLGNSCDYASYVCYGTYKMSARNFLDPAVEAAQESLDACMQEIEGQLQRMQDQMNNSIQQAQGPGGLLGGAGGAGESLLEGGGGGGGLLEGGASNLLGRGTTITEEVGGGSRLIGAAEDLLLLPERAASLGGAVVRTGGAIARFGELAVGTARAAGAVFRMVATPIQFFGRVGMFL